MHERARLLVAAAIALTASGAALAQGLTAEGISNAQGASWLVGAVIVAAGTSTAAVALWRNVGRPVWDIVHSSGRNTIAVFGDPSSPTDHPGLIERMRIVWLALYGHPQDIQTPGLLRTVADLSRAVSEQTAMLRERDTVIRAEREVLTAQLDEAVRLLRRLDAAEGGRGGGQGG